MADADAQRAAAAAQAKEDARLMREAAQDPTKIHVVLDEAFKNKQFLKVHQKLTYVCTHCMYMYVCMYMLTFGCLHCFFIALQGGVLPKSKY